MKGIDCCAQITYSFGQELVNQDVNFAGRYLVPGWNSMLWKRLTTQEAQICTDLGIELLSIFELDIGDTKGGAIKGTEHGILAYQEAKNVGQPEGSGICFTVDYEATEDDFDTIEEYLRAAKEQIVGYKIGVYGSFAVIEAMAKRNVCDFYFQCRAWSYNQISEYRNIYQYGYDEKIDGIDVDINDFYMYKGNGITWNYNTHVTKSQPQEDVNIDTIVEPVNSVEEPVFDWKKEAMDYLKNGGFIKSEHDPDEPVTMAMLGQMLINRGW